MTQPHEGHLNQVLCILAYLKYHINASMIFDDSMAKWESHGFPNTIGLYSIMMRLNLYPLICLSLIVMVLKSMLLWMQTMLVIRLHGILTQVFSFMAIDPPWFGNLNDKIRWNLQHLAPNLLPQRLQLIELKLYVINLAWLGSLFRDMSMFLWIINLLYSMLLIRRPHWKRNTKQLHTTTFMKLLLLAWFALLRWQERRTCWFIYQGSSPSWFGELENFKFP